MDPGVDRARLRLRKPDASQDLDCATVKTHARALPQRPRVGQQVETDIEPPGRLEGTPIRQRVAARQLGDLDAAQIDGHAPAGLRRGLRTAVHLQPADLDHAVPRQDGEALVDLHAAGDERAGRDRAEPLHREHAIDWKPYGSVSPSEWHRRRHRRQRGAESRQALAGARRHRHDRGIGEKRTGHELAHVEPGEGQRLLVDEVALGQNDDASWGRGAGGRCESARASAASPTRRRRR